MNLPVISVLMPVYNAENYIKDAVESILNQTLTDFEFIIINDGSTDGTLAILESYAKLDGRICLISRENKGLIDTLNEGITLVKSPLIARMDADDIALPSRFEEQFNYLTSHPDVICVGGASIIIDEESRELNLLLLPVSDDEIQNKALLGHCPINHPAAMFSTQAIKSLNGYRKDFYPSEDLDLWLRMGEIGKLANLKNAVIKYRFISNSISGRMAEEQNSTARKACEEAWSRRGIKGRFEAKGNWRPTNSRNSQHVFLLKLGWWAYNYKNKTAALLYGIKAIQKWPLNRGGWNLVYCSLFK